MGRKKQRRSAPAAKPDKAATQQERLSLLIVIGSARVVSTHTVFNHTIDEPAHIACGLEWTKESTNTNINIRHWRGWQPPSDRTWTVCER